MLVLYLFCSRSSKYLQLWRVTTDKIADGNRDGASLEAENEI